MTDSDFRAVMGHFCTGVAIVTGCLEQLPMGFTVQSVQSISLEPPLVAISPAKCGTTWPKIRSSGRFCLNFLGADQHPLCRRFAQAGIDRFDRLSWTLSKGGSPILAGVLGYVDCQVHAEYEAGDHTIALGLVLDLAILHPDPKPLLFFRGRMGSFADQVG